jgi:hypothetical protein
MARVREEELSPIQMVAREVSLHTDMSEGDLHSSLQSLLWRLMDESSSRISESPLASDSLERALQYRALAEVIVVFDSTLAALRDIDGEWT